PPAPPNADPPRRPRGALSRGVHRPLPAAALDDLLPAAAPCAAGHAAADLRGRRPPSARDDAREGRRARPDLLRRQFGGRLVEPARPEQPLSRARPLPAPLP